MLNSQNTEMLRIMPREMRMMTERILSLTSLPKGFYLAAQDLVMYSQKLGLGGFALLEERFELLKHADLGKISIISEEGATLRLDAGDQHAWCVIPGVIDLLGELAHSFGAARITVVNALDPSELQLTSSLAARNGIAVTVAGSDEILLAASAISLSGDISQDEPLLWELLQEGAAMPAPLWWRIYHLAQKALAPDSVVSRRHAGPLIVNDDGTVIGRKDNDDETDISFLTSPKISGYETEGAHS